MGLIKIADKFRKIDSKPFVSSNRAALAAYCLNGQIATDVQVNACVKYFASASGDFNAAEFERACGVGFSMSKDEISSALEGILNKLGAKADEKKHSCFGMVMGEFRKASPFADQKLAAQLCNVLL